jgi:hypothetical protein
MRVFAGISAPLLAARARHGRGASRAAGRGDVLHGLPCRRATQPEAPDGRGDRGRARGLPQRRARGDADGPHREGVHGRGIRRDRRMAGGGIGHGSNPPGFHRNGRRAGGVRAGPGRRTGRRAGGRRGRRLRRRHRRPDARGTRPRRHAGRGVRRLRVLPLQQHRARRFRRHGRHHLRARRGRGGRCRRRPGPRRGRRCRCPPGDARRTDRRSTTTGSCCRPAST